MKDEQPFAIPGMDRETFRRTIAMTGARARIDAAIHQSYIVYMKDGRMVKEYSDGRIEEIKEND